VRHALDTSNRKQDDIGSDLARRSFYGALAEFGNGGSVHKLSLPSDYSTTRIDSILPGVAVPTIAHVLADLGLNLPTDSIRLAPSTSDSTITAFITFEQSDSAELLCTQLKAAEILPSAFQNIQATVIPPRFPFGSTARRTQCRKVLLSWYKPTKLVWLNFGSQAIAARVGERFSNGEYRVCDNAVKAGRVTGGNNRGRGGHHNPVAWTVVLQNVPSDATKEDIARSMTRSDDKPRHIEMGNMLGSYDINAAPIMVASLLTHIGRVNFNLQTTNTKFRAIAIFESERDAREALRSLHGQRQTFLNGQKLTVQLLCSAKFKVQTRLFELVQGQFDAHRQSWQDQHVRLNVFSDTSSGNKFTTLRIEGEEPRSVAKAADIIESVLGGQIIIVDGLPYWSAALTTNSSAYQTLKQIESSYDVRLVRNSHKRHIYFFGPPQKLEEVHAALVGRLDCANISIHVIELNREDFLWACRGGFNFIRTTISESNVSFDIVSTPKRIIITGSVADLQQAKDALRNKNDAVTNAQNLHGNDDCSICWTPAETPVTLHCQHVYCLDCFEWLSMAASSSAGIPKVLCQGNAGSCGEVVHLNELQTHLSSAAFEDLLECMLKSHIDRRPEVFRYCPSPDCGYVYRVGDGARTCVKCLVMICTDCHEQHGTMSCADYKDLKSGDYEAFEKFKKAMNIKDCPKCRTSIERTEGCNHMTCTGCRTHLCWVCLETFSTSGETYDHLSAVHGGIFEGPEYR
jgi:hypothetical protein